MIPLAVPNLCGKEAQYLKECIDSTFVSSVGPFVTRFEKMAAEASGGKEAVAVCSGTAALHTALMSIGVRRDDLVILPSFTFIASSNAIAHCGAEPWLFDIDPETWTLDVNLVEEALKTMATRQGKDLIHKSSGRRIAAVMPVYTLGLPADMEALTKLAKHYNLPVIADAAPALGATYKGKPLASWADLTVFSFNGNKTITAGAGGAVVGNSENILKLARHISTTARISSDYDHDQVGYNYRMTNLQAAVGCAQLENLDKFVQAKIQIRKNYDEAFRSFKGVGLFPMGDRHESVCWFSGITLEDKSFPKVKEVCEELKKLGIESRPFWKPAHLQLPYKGSPRTSQNVSEEIWTKILTLPCSTQLTGSDQIKIIDALKKILKGGANGT
jgi:dTDP-4-amino-4,6-dideoxygalactose transaminase